MSRVLVVIDYQKDFVDGSLGFEGAELLEAGIAALVEQRLAEGCPVVFTLDTHGDDYMQTREGRHLPVPHCRDGGDGQKLYGSLSRYMGSGLDGVHFIKKPGFGADPGAYDFLRACDPTEFELCGLVSSICVISNAVVLQTIFREAEITVYSDLCGGGDKKLHQESLDVMEGLQMNVKAYSSME